MGKKPRLNESELASLIACPRCPEAQVHRILSKIQHEPASEREWRKEIQQLHELVLTRITFNLPCAPGQRLPVAKLTNLLTWFCEEVPCFERLLLATCQKRRAERSLRLIAYADEVTPGDPLRPDNLRKSYLMYASLIDFGKHLQSSYAWLPVCVLKHSFIDTVQGGLSRILRDIFRLWKLMFAYCDTYVLESIYNRTTLFCGLWAV
jgi:hypothetical protein